MNKVFNINLGGLVFTIDDVAFDKLNKYINKLKAHFGNTEGASEIIADIEARMAELIQQKLLSLTDIVGEQIIDEVIIVMGDVNQMDDESKSENSNQTHQQTAHEFVGDKKLRRNLNDKVFGGVCSGIADYLSVDSTLVRILFLIAFFIFGSGFLIYIILWIVMKPASSEELSSITPRNKKKLFRDTDDKVISGVCAGIANYIGLDAVWVRIFFAIGFFVFGVGFWIYIALWIAVPKAITAAQKLQMKGDPIDISTIEREVKNTFNNAKQNTPKVANEMQGMANRAGNALTEIASLFVKVIGKLVAIVLLVIGICGIIALAFAYVSIGELKEFMIMAIDNGDIINAFRIGFLLAIGIPLLALIITSFRLLLNLKFKKGIVYSVLGITSFIGVAILVYAFIQYLNSIDDKATFTKNISIENYDTLYLQTAINNFEGKKIRFSPGLNQLNLCINDEGLMQGTAELNIKKSFSDSSYIELKKSSKGIDKSEALQLAEAIQYDIKTNGSHIIFDEGIQTPKGSKWKFPTVKMNLRIPVGTILIADEEVLRMLNRNMDWDERYTGKTLLMTDKGLKCLDPESDTNNKDNNFELSIEDIDNEDSDDNVDINMTIHSDNDSTSGIHIIKKKKNIIIKNGKKTQVEENQIGPLHIKIEKSDDEKK